MLFKFITLQDLWLYQKSALIITNHFAVNLHDRRPSSISTSKISHVTENGDWFGVQTEGDQFSDIRPIRNN